jgi:TetR/AcrR family transcriptional regulator of autoinduction and epiphytic fitness
MLKSFAFWPQISLGLPSIEAAMQDQVVDSALDMFLACYQLA